VAGAPLTGQGCMAQKTFGRFIVDENALFQKIKLGTFSMRDVFQKRWLFVRKCLPHVWPSYPLDSFAIILFTDGRFYRIVRCVPGRNPNKLTGESFSAAYRSHIRVKARFPL
jgi:hypothetical protein